ncbi:MAG: hypothetical protein KF894_21860 [Labilithrix sp.]|nr:hypothetical protein [Labilithrix sp.]
MSQRFSCCLVTLAILGGAASFVACTIQTSDGGDPSAGGDSGVAPDAATDDPDAADAAPPELDECVVYEPAVIEGVKEGSFADGDDVQFELITVNDPGGGLVTVTVDSYGAAGAEVQVRHADGATRVGFDNTSVTTNPKLVFRAGGGESYRLEVMPPSAFNAAGSAYKFSWSYEPIVDCYEKNDDKASAKRIPVDTEITAYDHAGVKASMGPIITSGTDDWYRFVLDEPKTVRLVTSHPRPIVEFLLIDGADKTRIRQARTSEEAIQASNTAALEAGEYFVHFESTTSLTSAVPGDREVPAFWTQPYTLRVETVEPADD